MAKYSKINKCDTQNGEGIRVSVFFSGCEFYCKDCFNNEIWSFDKGEEFTKDTIKLILDLCDKSYIKGLSILGGEPLHNKNVENVCKLCVEFKRRFPKKNIWLWTGFVFEEIDLLSKTMDLDVAIKYVEAENKHEDLYRTLVMHRIDVLVDGRFECDKRDLTLKWKGSSNQRVIDIKKTLSKNKVVLYEE